MISDGPSITLLADFVNGFAFKSEHFEDEGLPVIRIKQLLDSNAEGDRTTLTVPEVMINNGDVIFSWSASLAVRIWDRGPALLNQHLFRVDPKPGVHSGWLAYTLMVAAKRLEALMHGSAMTHITRDMLKLVTVTLPPEREQRAIADYLDAETARIDALIEKKRRLAQRLNQRLGVEHERLVLGQDQVGGNSTNGGFYGATAWPETALRHLNCEVQTGPFGSQLHADDYVRGGWPVVNPSNIVAGKVIALPEVTIDDETRNRLVRHLLKPGDIVFGRRGEMGRAGLVSEQEAGWICGTGSLRLRLVGDLLLPEYLKLLLETGTAKRYFQLSSVGSTMENLNTEILLAMPVLVPPIEEQARVVNIVSRSRSHNHKLETKLNRSIELLTEHRQSLITAAVTGQVEVTGGLDINGLRHYNQ